MNSAEISNEVIRLKMQSPALAISYLKDLIKGRVFTNPTVMSDIYFELYRLYIRRNNYKKAFKIIEQLLCATWLTTLCREQLAETLYELSKSVRSDIREKAANLLDLYFFCEYQLPQSRLSIVEEAKISADTVLFPHSFCRDPGELGCDNSKMEKLVEWLKSSGGFLDKLVVLSKPSGDRGVFLKDDIQVSSILTKVGEILSIIPSKLIITYEKAATSPINVEIISKGLEIR